jgi:hypothetical protein
MRRGSIGGIRQGHLHGIGFRRGGVDLGVRSAATYQSEASEKQNYGSDPSRKRFSVLLRRVLGNTVSGDKQFFGNSSGCCIDVSSLIASYLA